MNAIAHASATLTIDLDALVVNWRAIRTRAAPAATGAVVKANAYGPGSLRVSAPLASAGCSHFCVAPLSAARDLAARLPAPASLQGPTGLETLIGRPWSMGRVRLSV